MKKYWIWSMVSFALMQSPAEAQTTWPQVQKEMKPWTRWWWPGSAVDKKNLSAELTKLADAGFGGVEVTPIYGAKGFEQKYIPFLSPQWLDMLNYGSEKANSLGMGLDMNLGTGWPFGGPQVEVEYAATKLLMEELNLSKGEEITLPLRSQDAKQTYTKAQAISGYDRNGSKVDLSSLLNQKQGTWKAPEDMKVLILFSGRTGQKVKRAAPGGEGLTLDHLGKASVASYFDFFKKKLENQPKSVRSFFNDSYEVYGADWTDEFLSEFKRRKGYALEDYLLEFAGKTDDKEKEGRLKSDYREVVNWILRDHFLLPFTEFSNAQGAISKNQAHGSPGNLLDLYASTDIPECETFGSSAFDIPGLKRDSADVRNVDPDPMMFKFASSATNTQGKKLTSSETFTWLTEHFKTALSQTKPEVEALFLSGVNHVFYHGTTYSPEEVKFPGWLFYASVNFVTQNSFWSHLIGLNQYITRVQSVLQTTEADNELLIYWPIYDIWQEPDKAFKQLSVHHVDHWLWPTQFYKESVHLQKRGYGFDFISDEQIKQTQADGDKLITHEAAKPYQAIFIPETQYFSEETLDKLLKLAEEGATLIFQSAPKDIPGFHQVVERKERLLSTWKKIGFKADEPNQYKKFGKGKIYLTKDVVSALETEQIFGESLTRAGLKFHRRIDKNAHYYYIVNHSPKTIDQSIKLNATGKTVTLLDPQTGKIADLPMKDGQVRFQLAPGYAWVVTVSDEPAQATKFHYVDQEKTVNVFTQPWNLSFISGGPKLPTNKKLNKLSYWTDLQGADYQSFSGSAAYETQITLNKEADKSYRLKLDNLSESAKILVNGKEAGILWSNPFELDVTEYLTNGKNQIRIEVANLMANRVRDMDKKGMVWRNYHEINFVNIDYKPFDAGKWAVANSGLKGPVTLIAY
ncbi:glycosyl hydrolase [Sphingobacterium hotanense]|uniref:glycosyl hydrolase n=1 Tax=Sphingobacterium hotanense TaxID=649196 RepID=UPI0011F240C4|nr:glycosyl hydrolase [Sphingobacterium hotanense]